MVALRCSSCGTMIQVDVRTATGAIVCPQCRASVEVPGADRARGSAPAAAANAWQAPSRPAPRPTAPAAAAPPRPAAPPPDANSGTERPAPPKPAATPLRAVPMGRPTGPGGEAAPREERIVRRPPPRRRDGMGGGPASMPGPGSMPSQAPPPTMPGYPSTPAGYPQNPAYPPAASYPAPGYPAPAGPMPGGMAIPGGMRMLEHIPGGPMDAEQARRAFLESQFDQVWSVYVAAMQQGVPRPVVFLLDHSDERGRRIASLAHPAYGQPPPGPSLMRAFQGPLGPSYAEAAAFPVWRACEILGAEGLPHLYEPAAREAGPDQFLVLAVSLYGVSGFRMGTAMAGY